MPVQVCLAQGEQKLSDDTVLYKYMPIEAFLQLFWHRRVIFTRLIDWPDAYEGFLFDFLSKHRKDSILEGRSSSDLYGSCWTLQTEDSALYSTREEYTLAQGDLRRHGSAPMWESYCRNGGVRIQTTLGKLTRLFAENLPNAHVFHGKVSYVPYDAGLHAAIRSVGTSRALFVKRVAFRYEAEYRYMLLPEDSSDRRIIPVPTGDLYDLLDEVLIAPATKPRVWLARTIYNLGVGIASGPGRGGTNFKNDRQLCRISQLYGTISEEIGFP
jgi:hypothetical protein